MLADLAIFLGSLFLMGVVALRANATLPAGRLPMGRTMEANANRLIVLLQMPLLFVVDLLVIGLLDVFKGEHSANVIPAQFSLASLAVVMLLAQQAQYWRVRSIVRKPRPREFGLP